MTGSLTLFSPMILRPPRFDVARLDVARLDLDRMIDGNAKTGNNRDDFRAKVSRMVSASPENWFDFIVIGSGTGGAVLAGRLSEEADLGVALVEAGGPADDPRIAEPLAWPALQGSAVDWGFATVAQPHTAGRMHAWPR